MQPMSQLLLLGATLLHTRYGHWQPKSGHLLIRPVTDHFRNYPGLVDKLLAIRRRALNDEHTIYDQQRIQWLAQAYFGALDIYQREVSIRSVSREDILEEIDDWLANQENSLAAALFAPLAADK
jgi:hypothetical protein